MGRINARGRRVVVRPAAGRPAGMGTVGMAPAGAGTAGVATAGAGTAGGVGKAAAAPAPDARLAEALAFHRAGRLAEAEAGYRAVLDVLPEHPDALHLLGVLAYQAGRPHVAAATIGRAIRANGRVAAYHSNLGNALLALGKHDEAVAAYGRAIVLDPANADAHYNLGNLRHALGRHAEAIASLRRAARLRPDHADTHYTLANALVGAGRADEALPAFRRALACDPDHADARLNLAHALFRADRREDALRALLEGLERAPDHDGLLRSLVMVLRDRTISDAGPVLRAALLRICADETIDTQDLLAPLVSLMRRAPAFEPLLASARAGSDPFAAAGPLLGTLLDDPLVHAALPGLLVGEPETELVLAHLRRWILARSRASRDALPSWGGAPAAFVCALAGQGFASEYVALVEPHEAGHLAGLVADVERALAAAPDAELPLLEPWLAIVAAYRPLSELAGVERLLGVAPDRWGAPFRAVLDAQVGERARERQIAAALPSLTPIDEGVSAAVRAMYEANPYPRWRAVHRQSPEGLVTLARRLRPEAPPPAYPSPAPILIAGAGTGRHAVIVANRYPDADILAVDLSRASLAYGARMAERLGIANVTFAQADLLRLGERTDLQGRFALIESVGVLHHLDDPLVGWAALRRLLRPDGIMKIGLYSDPAREGIVAAREWLAERGFAPTPDGIRAARRAIIDLPEGHPARRAIRSHDFHAASGFRDLLMHVQEHRFTTERLAESLDRLGLRFLGFDLDGDVLAHFGVRFPAPGSELDLACWGAYEAANPDTFAAMYTFWCCPIDA